MSKHDDDQTAPPRVDFIDFLATLSEGKAREDLTERLARVSEAVDDTGLPGELTIKLKIKPTRGMAEVTVDTTEKCPRDPIPHSLFHVHKGRLMKKDPRQLTMEKLEEPPRKLRPVDLDE